MPRALPHLAGQCHDHGAGHHQESMEKFEPSLLWGDGKEVVDDAPACPQQQHFRPPPVLPMQKRGPYLVHKPKDDVEHEAAKGHGQPSL